MAHFHFRVLRSCAPLKTIKYVSKCGLSLGSFIKLFYEMYMAVSLEL